MHEEELQRLRRRLRELITLVPEVGALHRNMYFDERSGTMHHPNCETLAEVENMRYLGSVSLRELLERELCPDCLDMCSFQGRHLENWVETLAVIEELENLTIPEQVNLEEARALAQTINRAKGYTCDTVDDVLDGPINAAQKRLRQSLKNSRGELDAELRAIAIGSSMGQAMSESWWLRRGEAGKLFEQAFEKAKEYLYSTAECFLIWSPDGEAVMDGRDGWIVTETYRLNEQVVALPVAFEKELPRPLFNPRARVEKVPTPRALEVMTRLKADAQPGEPYWDIAEALRAAEAL